MRTGTLVIGAAVLVLAAGCNRNDTQTSSGFPQNDSPQASITLTGCLQTGAQGLGSQEPSASRPAEGDRFVLANARTPVSPSGPAADTAGPLYILEGEEDELRQHVGHQVEVSGTPDDDADGGPANARRLDVESVRMIAASCATP